VTGATPQIGQSMYLPESSSRLNFIEHNSVTSRGAARAQIVRF